MPQSRDIEFLYEIGSLNNVDRSWRQHLAMKCATVPEHTMRVIWLALLIARQETGADEDLIIKMAMVHDIAETRVSDLSYIQKVYVTPDENRAVSDLFAGTVFGDFENILKKYDARDSLEAKIVKDADNLDVEIELKELEERGSKLSQKWAATRRIVRDKKLYTDSARTIWDELQTSDPADWHLTSNKWYKMPDTGR
ncbi:MAG: HD domain-containing protein [Patescibacteria group bacterium]|jgi:putative hydrolase of HD superfamily